MHDVYHAPSRREDPSTGHTSKLLPELTPPFRASGTRPPSRPFPHPTVSLLALVLTALLGFLNAGQEGAAMVLDRNGSLFAGPDTLRADSLAADSLAADSLAAPDSLEGQAALPEDTTAAMPVEVQEAAAEEAGSGEASYYGKELAGERTASGERFDPSGLTAAHPTLPMGSRVRVTNTHNGRSVVVRINDRGPFSRRRIIDLSYAAAKRLGMIASGIAHVRLELLR
jgi:rare lipoprotein A